MQEKILLTQENHHHHHYHYTASQEHSPFTPFSFRYERIEGRRKQMRAFTQLLEEVRGRPRSVDPEESLTESERHFLIHDFADFP